jgi:DNA-binding beta-propeller fold protein YncE
MRGYARVLFGTLALGGLLAIGLPPGRAADPVPRFVVDPYWPKPLPNRWVTGAVGGICVDAQDHVFGINRADLTALEKQVGKIAAPIVIEYDADGNVVNSWGDPAVLPIGIHGCFVDKENNLWIAGSGDGFIQKWTHDGKKMLLQIGTKGQCDNAENKCGEPGLNASQTKLNDPADIAVDPVNGDIYVADGYGNHRIVVFDAQGKFLRQWGTSGVDPGQFSPTGGGHPHCAVFDKDHLLHVCDRGNDRVQVFDRMGKLQRIIAIKPGTGYVPGPAGDPPRKGVGSALDIAFSIDPDQKYMYVVDTGNEVLWIVDHKTGTIVGGFGSAGHAAGEFTLLHMIAVDSKGNLYTSETVDGRRLQKFTPAGTVPENKLTTYLGSPHYEPWPDGKF